MSSCKEFKVYYSYITYVTFKLVKKKKMIYVFFVYRSVCFFFKIFFCTWLYVYLLNQSQFSVHFYKNQNHLYIRYILDIRFKIRDKHAFKRKKKEKKEEITSRFFFTTFFFSYFVTNRLKLKKKWNIYVIFYIMHAFLFLKFATINHLDRFN